MNLSSLLKRLQHQFVRPVSRHSRKNRPQATADRVSSQVEAVESRQLLTVFTWDQGGDGVNFDDPENWAVDGQAEPDSAPGISDDIIIDLNNGGVPFTIQINGDEAVGSVSINSDDATLRVNDNFSLTVTNDTVVQDGRLLVDGDFTSDGLTNLDRLRVSRSGATIDAATFENHGDFDISRTGSVSVTLANGFTNSGTVNLRNATTGNSGFARLTVDSGTVVNEATGVINIVDGGGRRELNLPALKNAGTINFDDADVRFIGASPFISNTGLINIPVGVLVNTLAPAVTVNQNGGTLNVDGDLILNNGTLNVAGGIVNITDSIVVNSGDVSISGGTVSNEGTFRLSNANMSFTGGDILGANAVRLSGNRNLSITHDGSLDATISGDRTISGELAENQSLAVIAQNSALIAAAGFVNRGSITFDNPDNSAQELGSVDGSAFENAATGTLKFTRSDDFAFVGAFIATPINNSGSIEIDTIVSDSKEHTLRNTGSFDVTASGRYTRGTGGSVQNIFDQADGTLTIHPAGSFDGGGLELHYIGGVVTGSASLRDLTIGAGAGNSGTFLPTSTITGDILNGQTVQIRRDVEAIVPFSNSGTIIIEPSFDTQGSGVLNNVNAPLTINADGQLIFETDIDQTLTVFGEVGNNGTITVRGAGKGRVATATNRGTVNISDDATLQVLGNGVLNHLDGALAINGKLQISPNSLFSYQGGEIDGTVRVSNGVLEFADTVSPAEFDMTDGEFLTDIPAGAHITISNPETTTDRVELPSNFTVNGTLILGTDTTQGNIELVGANTLAIGETGRVEAAGNTSSRVINAPLVNEGLLTITVDTRIGSPDAEHSNAGTIHLNDEVLTIVGSGLTNDIDGEITGTGALNHDDGVSGTVATSFINRGTIAPGQSQGTLTITATNSVLESTGSVQFEIDGLNLGTEFDRLNFSTSATLGGNLTIETADDFTPSVGTAFDILVGNQLNGQFDTVNAVGNPNITYSIATTNQAVTATVIEQSGDLSSAFTSVPAAGISTDTFEIQYSVTNEGGDTTVGSWTDRIYLSPTPDFDAATALLFAEVDHVGNVANGDSYSETVVGKLPPVLPGSYQLILITDTRLQTTDGNRDNNRVTSSAIDVDVTEITIGSPITIDIEGDETRLVRFTPPADNTVQITSTSTVAGGHSISTAAVVLPQNGGAAQTSFNTAGSTNSLTIPDSTADSYFLSIQSRDAAAGTQSVTVNVELLPLQITGISRDSGSNRGSVTFDVNGAKFASDSVVRLVASSGNVLDAASTRFSASTQLTTAFDLTGIATGIYDVQVESGGEIATLEDSFEVNEASLGRTVSVLTNPAAVRNGRTAGLSVQVANVGNTDVTAALHTILVPNGFLGVGDDADIPDLLEFIAISETGQAGTLPPDDTTTLGFTFRKFTSEDSYDITLLTPEADRELDHNEVKDDLRPDSIDAEDWDAIFAAYVATAGSTYADYQQLLARAATELRDLGVSTPDAARLRAFEFIKHGAAPTIAAQIADGTVEPADLQSALDEIARPLSLNAMVRREGSDVPSQILQSSLDIAIRNATADVLTSLEATLGEGYVAALSVEERSDLENAIRAAITEDGFAGVGAASGDLIDAIAANDLEILEPFRDAGLTIRTEIQEIATALRTAALDSMAGLSEPELADLLRGISIRLEQGATVDSLTQSASDDPEATINDLLDAALQSDVDEVLASVNADFQRLLSGDGLASLRASIGSQLQGGASVAALIAAFQSQDLSLIDLLLADERLRDRQIDNFVSQIRELGGADAIDGLSDQQAQELRRQAGRALDAGGNLLVPQRIADALRNNNGRGGRGALDSLNRQFAVNDFLNDVRDAGAAEQIDALGEAEVDELGNQIEDIIGDQDLAPELRRNQVRRVREGIVNLDDGDVIARLQQEAKEREAAKRADELLGANKDQFNDRQQQELKDLFEQQIDAEGNDQPQPDALREVRFLLFAEGANAAKEALDRNSVNEEAERQLDKLRQDESNELQFQGLDDREKAELEKLIAERIDADDIQNGNLANEDQLQGSFGILLNDDRASDILGRSADERFADDVLDSFKDVIDDPFLEQNFNSQQVQALRDLFLQQGNGTENENEQRELAERVADDVIRREGSFDFEEAREFLNQVAGENRVREAIEQVAAEPGQAGRFDGLDAEATQALIERLADVPPDELGTLDQLKDQLRGAVSPEQFADGLRQSAIGDRMDELFDQMRDALPGFDDLLADLGGREQAELKAQLGFQFQFDDISEDQFADTLIERLPVSLEALKQQLGKSADDRQAGDEFASDPELQQLVNQLSLADKQELTDIVGGFLRQGPIDNDILKDLIQEGNFDAEEVRGLIDNTDLDEVLFRADVLEAGGEELQDSVDQLGDFQRAEFDQTLRESLLLGESAEELANRLLNAEGQGLNSEFLINETVDRATDDILDSLLQDPEASSRLAALNSEQLSEFIGQILDDVDYSLQFVNDRSQASEVLEEILQGNAEFLQQEDVQGVLNSDIEDRADLEFIAVLEAVDSTGAVRFPGDKAASDEFELQIRELRESGATAEEALAHLFPAGQAFEDRLLDLAFERVQLAVLDELLLDARIGGQLPDLTDAQVEELLEQTFDSVDFSRGIFEDQLAEGDATALIARISEDLADDLLFDDIPLADRLESDRDEREFNELFEGVRDALAESEGEASLGLSDEARFELRDIVNDAQDSGVGVDEILDFLDPFFEVESSGDSSERLENLRVDRFADKAAQIALQNAAAAAVLDGLSAEQKAQLNVELEALAAEIADLAGDEAERAIDEIGGDLIALLSSQDVQAALDTAREQRRVDELFNDVFDQLLDSDPELAFQLELLDDLANHGFDLIAAEETDAAAVEARLRNLLVLGGELNAELRDGVFRDLVDKLVENNSSNPEFQSFLQDIGNLGFTLEDLLLNSVRENGGNIDSAQEIINGMLEDPDAAADNLDDRSSATLDVSDIVQELEELLSEDLTREERDALREQLINEIVNGGSKEEVLDRLTAKGGEGFVQDQRERALDDAVTDMFSKILEVLSNLDADLSPEEEQQAREKLKDEAEAGKSVKEVEQAIDDNSGQGVGEAAGRSDEDCQAKAEEMADGVIRTQFSLLVNQNEPAPTPEERKRLVAAIKDRLKNGDSPTSINRDLKTLSKRKFQNLLGRSNQSDDEKQNDADAHEQAAADKDQNEQQSTGSIDPNDILGPAGFGDEQFIRGENRLDYTIRFENLETASAAAQEIRVTQQLDADFDLTTFELQSFGFGDNVVEIPEGLDQFSTRLDLRDSIGLLVDFEAGLDVTSGVVTWFFQAIDPETGDLPVLEGFLPPNVIPGEGEGFVAYSIQPKSELATGDVLDALATIVFDLENPISTPAIFNTIDADSPTATFGALPQVTNTVEIPISWAGSDVGSGVNSFDVFVSTDGGSFELFLNDIIDTESTFFGEDNRRYDFFVVATDNVGRVGSEIPVTQASTTLDVNDVPVAAGETVSTSEDTPVTISVLDNDVDVDNDVLTVDITNQPQNGTVAVNGDGSVTYSPEADFHGTDQFSYVVRDGRGSEDTATAIVVVNSVNDAPVANTDVVGTLEDTAVVIDVLSNDADVDGNLELLQFQGLPSNGTLTFNANRTFTYTPDRNFHGTDSFTYQLSDEFGAQSVGSVQVNVSPVNDRPFAVRDTAETSEDTSIVLTPLINDGDVDGDALEINLFTEPDDGQALLNGDGTVTFTPNPDFNGLTSVIYQVTDTAGIGSFGEILINVNAVNDAPAVAVPIADMTVNEDAADAVIDLTNVFDDIDSANLTVSAVSSDGSLVSTSLNGTNLTLSFAADQNGTATVTVTANDGELTESDTFAVTVNAVNDAPTVGNPLADVTVDEDAVDQVIDLSNIFDDIDSANLTLSVISSDGSLVNASRNGTDLTLSFAADANGATTVTVTADDNELTTSDTFTVTVNVVNDAPTIANSLADVSVDEDAADQVIDLSGVFDDIDSANLTLSAVSSDGNLVSTSLNGTDLTLSFAADANGTATVNITADDGSLTVSDTFTVTVNAVNDAPTVTDPLMDVVVDEGAVDQLIDLASVFDDIDSANLTLTAVSSDGSLVSTSLNGTDLTLSFAAGQSGSATITVTTDDGEFTASDTFNVTVNSVTGGPKIISLDGPNLAIVGNEASFSATSTGAITQTWQVIDSTGEVVAAGTGADFNFTPETTGAFTVVVTAEDAAGATDSEQLNLTVAQLGVIDGDLVVAGTNGHDSIGVYADADGDFHVYMNGAHAGEFAGVTGEIIVDAGNGNDAVYVSRFITHDTQLSGGNGHDWIVGGSGNDNIDGGNGHDWINGRSGNDVIHGSNGHDILFGQLGDDELHGGRGNDWLFGGDGDDDLFGGAGHDFLSGGAGSDLLDGASGRDVLLGGSGDDVLLGGSGRDLLIGGSGNDTIDGGPGRDWWC